MGVAEDYGAYNLYDPVAKEFFPSDSCVFDEFSFGFKELMDRVTGNPTPSVNLRDHLMTINDWSEMNYTQDAWTDDFKEDNFPIVAQQMKKKTRFADEKEEAQEEPEKEMTTPVRPGSISARRTLVFPLENEASDEEIEIPGGTDEWETIETTDQPDVSIPGTPALSIPWPSSSQQSQSSESHTPTPNSEGNLPLNSTPVRRTPGKPIGWKQPVVQSPVVIQERRSECLKPPGKQCYYGAGSEYVNLVEGMTAERAGEQFSQFEEDAETVTCYKMIDHLVNIMQEEKNAMKKLCPGSHRQAASGSDAAEWRASKTREIYTHILNGTWTLVPCPKSKFANGKHHVVMRSVWKYRIKMQQLVIVNYKSRLCADGSTVEDSASNVFAGTPIPNAINAMFALAVHNGASLLPTYRCLSLMEILYTRLSSLQDSLMLNIQTGCANSINACMASLALVNSGT
jgi:hypothetical protein